MPLNEVNDYDKHFSLKKKYKKKLHKMEIARTLCSHFIRDGLLTPFLLL